jgi:hypothetical protein
MKSADLFQIKVNHYGSHIVVDLMIVIIITTICILLLNLLFFYRKKDHLDHSRILTLDFVCNVFILLILIITHLLFGLWPLIDYSLEKSLSPTEFFFFPFIYGVYLTFFMKKINQLLNPKLEFMKIGYLSKTLSIGIHFSIVPLMIASVIVLFN